MLQYQLTGIQPFGWDEVWHGYIASFSNFTDFIDATRATAHPPLYFLLIWLLKKLGADFYQLRLLGIFLSALILLLLYLINNKLGVKNGLNYAILLIIATLPQFSEMGIVLRSYQLAILACLFNLYLLLCYISRQDKNSFTLLASVILILLCDLSAAFYVIATYMAISILYSGEIFKYLKSNPHKIMLAGIFILIPALQIKLTLHSLDSKTTSYKFIAQFLYDDQQPAIDYLAENFMQLTRIFSPFVNFSPEELIVCIIPLAISVLIMLFLTCKSQIIFIFSKVSKLLILTMLLALTGVALAGILKLYPFGGFLRHQYILLILLILAGIACSSATRLKNPNITPLGSFWIFAVFFAGCIILRLPSQLEHSSSFYRYQNFPNPAAETFCGETSFAMNYFTAMHFSSLFSDSRILQIRANRPGSNFLRISNPACAEPFEILLINNYGRLRIDNTLIEDLLKLKSVSSNKSISFIQQAHIDNLQATSNNLPDLAQEISAISVKHSLTDKTENLDIIF